MILFSFFKTKLEIENCSKANMLTIEKTVYFFLYLQMIKEQVYFIISQKFEWVERYLMHMPVGIFF